MYRPIPPGTSCCRHTHTHTMLQAEPAMNLYKQNRSRQLRVRLLGTSWRPIKAADPGFESEATHCPTMLPEDMSSQQRTQPVRAPTERFVALWAASPFEGAPTCAPKSKHLLEWETCGKLHDDIPTTPWPRAGYNQPQALGCNPTLGTSRPKSWRADPLRCKRRRARQMPNQTSPMSSWRDASMLLCAQLSSHTTRPPCRGNQ